MGKRAALGVVVAIVALAVAGCQGRGGAGARPAPTPALTYDEALQRAKQAFAEKRWERCVKFAGAALAQRPDDPAALALRGRSYHALERYKEAAADLKRAAGEIKDDAELFLALTDCLDALNRVEEAQRAAARAAELLPDDPEAHLANGLLLLELERFAEAHRALAVADDLSPNNPAVLLALARASLGQGEYDRAIDEAERAVRAAADEAISRGEQPAPEDLLPVTVEVKAYLLKGNEESARVAQHLLEQYLEDVGEDWKARAEMAWAVLDAGQAQLAAKCVKEVVREKEAQPEARAAYAAALLALGRDFDTAQRCIDTALAHLTPAPPRYLAVKGWLAFKLGKTAEAERALSAAVAATRTPSERERWGKLLRIVRQSRSQASAGE